jgi:hypothetical protein
VEYEASADIKAAPETIWRVLVDAASYPGWDSGVVRIDGTIAPGEKIKLVSEVNPKRAFPLRVTTFEHPSRMQWSGGMPLGLFRGVRTFTLTPGPDGTTHFEMREEFSGPLRPLIGRTLPDFGPSFTQFANGLKHRAEGMK